MLRKKITILLLLICILGNNITVFAVETKYPDYAYEFLGEDKWEKTNRKIFNFNQKLNKYAIRPIHILWSSIMPEYGMDRLNGIANNIEYPIRLISSLIQRDFTNSKNETIRFFTNSILGLGGMFDPARHLFHLEQSKENMEQALEKCKVKSGPFFVMPVLSFTNMRGLFGKVLDTALNPSCYIGSPILAIVKAALTINKTSYIQPLLKMIEATYADPYDITKKAYGIDSYIKKSNFDRVNLTPYLLANKDSEKKADKENFTNIAQEKNDKKVKIEVSSELILPDQIIYGGTNIDNILIPDYSAENFKLDSDIKLPDYNPQTPVIDSMRTALFSLPEVNNSIWNDMSIWNRSFSRRIKTSSIDVTEGRSKYKYRYILQKEKESPLAIILPSIGEGIMSSHSVLLGKIFYDAGYSVIIQGSQFQWEFVNSMPKNYYPGLPVKDAEILRGITYKIISDLEKENKCHFSNKMVIGTSLGAITTLFAASQENINNTLGDTKFISICPPINLVYALKQVDKNSEEWNKSPEDFKQRVASTAAKIVKLYETKNISNLKINNLPFSDDEAKMITGFVMHQKLSDLIYTIEKDENTNKQELYNSINNMGYQDYVKKYLINNPEDKIENLSYETSLDYISSYLENGKNYKIYHSLNDYLVNTSQLKKLKQITGDRMTLIDNGSHLGFLYRDEFINDLKNTIAQK